MIFSPSNNVTLGGVKSDTANSNVFSVTLPEESVTDKVISWIPGLMHLVLYQFQ